MLPIVNILHLTESTVNEYATAFPYLAIEAGIIITNKKNHIYKCLNYCKSGIISVAINIF